MSDILKFNMNKKCIINFAGSLMLLLFLFQHEGLSEGNNAYMELSEKGVATYEDGCRAVSHFTDVVSEDLSFDELILALKERGIVGKGWKHEAEKYLTRSELAAMECRVLKIRGGLAMRAIDTSRRIAGFVCRKLKINYSLSAPDIGAYKRYAHLEFLDNGLMPAGHKKKYVTGHDLLASMYRIEQYIKAGEQKKEQKKQRKSEPDKDNE